MNVLVVGSGAREHCLAWACARSPLVERVLVAPGNGGTAGVAENVPIGAEDAAEIVRLTREREIGLTVLGPEAAVDAGVGDALRAAGCLCFGPDREAGRIETSKAFAKQLMRDAGIPTADFATFTDPRQAISFARERQGRVAVKADGLAQGKGVVVCETPEESDAAIRWMLLEDAFGTAGRHVVVEERLTGPELSVFGVTDGSRVRVLPSARDFKRARDGDQGGNTGGMGAYSPPLGADDALTEEVCRTVLEPVVDRLRESGLEYRGVLYAGLMLTPDGPRVLEFNCRFGDPETQVVLPRLRTDPVPMLLAAARGDLGDADRPSWGADTAVAVVVASGGYPDAYRTGFPIEGLDEIPPDVLVCHAGTARTDAGTVVTAGGRVLTVTAVAGDLGAARAGAVDAAGRVRFPGGFHRRDIGAR